MGSESLGDLSLKNRPDLPGNSMELITCAIVVSVNPLTYTPCTAMVAWTEMAAGFVFVFWSPQAICKEALGTPYVHAVIR